MKISYTWLQSFFLEKLPTPEKVAELFTMHAFEVESVEAISRASGPDWILDVKVTPNRAHDCLSHRGIAYELASLLDTAIDEQGALPVKPLPRIAVGKPERTLTVTVEDPKLCRRYMGRVMENIIVQESPDWLQEALRAIGQRPINNIVDVANFVMFHIGQPLHAFDADELADGTHAPSIIARYAREGEIMTTLDEKHLTLTADDFVLADGVSVLGVAGVKGGMHSGVHPTTTNLILESACFAPAPLRRSAQRVGIRTDASVRFENDISPALAAEAMDLFTKLLLATAKTDKTKVGPVVDWYPRQRKPYVVGFRAADVRNILGVEVNDAEIGELLTRLHLPWKKVSPVEEVLKLAPKLLGKPYMGYGVQISYDAPEKFDCSSLTAWLYAQAGVAIPRMTIDQLFFGTPVEEKEMQPGDIIFSNTHDGGDVKYYTLEWMPGLKLKEGVDHCALYLGAGKIMHASRHNTKDGLQGSVIIEKLKEAELFQDIVGIRRMVADTDDRYVVTVPELRLDLRRKEDVVEEIGRLWGYERLAPVQPREVLLAPVPNPELQLADRLRDALIGAGFSETYLLALGNEGELELANALASDQAHLRCSLMPGMKHAVEENLKYQDEVKLFEIGHAFLKENETSEMPSGETTRLALGIGTKRKLKQGELFFELKGVLELLAQELHLNFNVSDDHFIWADTTRVGWLGTDGSAELQLEPLLALTNKPVQYVPIGRYPAITRDIALFVPTEAKVADVLATILAAAGPLVVRSSLFDIFEKEGKKSLGFRLVFQSKERTLQDVEVNERMSKVNNAVAEKGWTVR